MGKASRRKKNKQGESRKNYSRLQDHKKEGSVLKTPLNTMKMNTMSWANESAPEMLWAFLVASLFRRTDYLGCFREISQWANKNLNKERPLDREMHTQPDVIPDLTRLSELPTELLKEFVGIIIRHPLGYAALRPLLLYESLPGLSNWKEVLQVEPYESDFNTIGKAAVPMFDHQSEISTDVRWLKFVTSIFSGRIKFPPGMEERVAEVVYFPKKGDLRAVRPFIRSGEMMLRRNPTSKWVNDFWSESFERTGCIDPTSKDDYRPSATNSFNLKHTMDARSEIISAFHEHAKTTEVDAKLEGVTGLCLYGLALILELQFYRTDARITGRLILRTLVEVFITLKYLVSKNDDALWMSWRVYGNGQAKLAFLKAEEFSEDLPTFIEPNELETYANEDKWMEFLNIDIGHWNNSTLRSVAIEAGIKEIYDRYYQWTSTFSHGHWCATRDVNFIICHNPLHRLHRIPRLVHRSSNSVLEDAVYLLDLMLEQFEKGLGDAVGTIPRLTLRAEIKDKNLPE